MAACGLDLDKEEVLCQLELTPTIWIDRGRLSPVIRRQELVRMRDTPEHKIKMPDGHAPRPGLYRDFH